MQPAGPGLADAMGILDIPKKPAGGYIDDKKARFGGLIPSGRTGTGRYNVAKWNVIYRKLRGFCVASSGRNWDTLASAIHRLAMSLVGNVDLLMLLCPGDTN